MTMFSCPARSSQETRLRNDVTRSRQLIKMGVEPHAFTMRAGRSPTMVSIARSSRAQTSASSTGRGGARQRPRAFPHRQFAIARRVDESGVRAEDHGGAAGPLPLTPLTDALVGRVSPRREAKP